LILNCYLDNFVLASSSWIPGQARDDKVGVLCYSGHCRNPGH